MHTLIAYLLDVAAARHSHLCPRQVLGVRIGLAGVAALESAAADQPLRLLVILETDGCFVDGVGAATGCGVGKRSLRIEDYGKVAATFVDMHSEQAVRVAPQAGVRQRACAYAPRESSRYAAQLIGYQIMPAAELLDVQPVRLVRSAAEIMSRAGVRVDCACCGEEIINEREVIREGQALCRACAGEAYYVPCRGSSIHPQPAPRRREQGLHFVQIRPANPHPSRPTSAVGSVL